MVTPVFYVINFVINGFKVSNQRRTFTKIILYADAISQGSLFQEIWIQILRS